MAQDTHSKLQQAFNGFQQTAEKHKRLMWLNSGSKIGGILTATMGLPAAIMMGGIAPVGIVAVAGIGAVASILASKKFLLKNFRKMKQQGDEMDALSADAAGGDLEKLARLKEQFDNVSVELSQDVKPMKKIVFKPRR